MKPLTHQQKRAEKEKAISSTIDLLIDQFASRLAGNGFFVERTDNIDWVGTVERKLPAPLPPAFRSLVSRYMFLELEINPLWLFANTGETTKDEWQYAIFSDIGLYPFLLAQGYIQFARLDTGSYDPVCFATGQRTGLGECPIVRIDHEEILCNDTVVVCEEIAPSFVSFVELYLRRAAMR